MPEANTPLLLPNLQVVYAAASIPENKGQSLVRTEDKMARTKARTDGKGTRTEDKEARSIKSIGQRNQGFHVEHMEHQI